MKNRKVELLPGWGGGERERDCTLPYLRTRKYTEDIDYLIIQKVGDRDKGAVSVKTIANTISSNPMSDRLQLVIECKGYDTD